MPEFHDSHERGMLARLVARTLRRPGFFPIFPQTLEDRYEADTSVRRIAHLRLSIVFGLVIYNLFIFTDGVVVPDIGHFGLVVRLFVLTPGGLLLFYIVGRPRLPGFWRETAVGTAMTLFALGPLAIFTVSHSDHTEQMLTQAVLSIFFGTNVLQVRFRSALVLCAVNFVATLALLEWHVRMPGPMIAVLLTYSACAIIFALICNLTVERSRREAYLLALQERLRSAGLSEDRNKLAVLSATDSLTGLANRRALDDRLDAIWADETRRAEASIVLLDIDHFKRFNDFYGHLGGDECLKRLSALLREGCDRPGVFLARYGGEEFAIAIEGMAETDVTAFAGTLCQRVYKARIPHRGRDDGIQVITISLGVARICDVAVTDRQSLFDSADRALYAAKRTGRNRVVRFGSLEMTMGPGAGALPSGLRQVAGTTMAAQPMVRDRLAG